MESRLKPNVLFVDDEPNVLSALQRLFRRLASDLEISFVESGPEALRLMSRRRFDVVVADMLMPGMDGAQLLNEVARLHPYASRIILSGQSDRKLILKSAGPSHQFLAKPCDPDTLKAAVERTFTMRELLPDPALQEQITRMKTLPSHPAVHMKLLEELSRDVPSIRNLGRIVAQDVGMSAKILQLVNSGFFVSPRLVSEPDEAVHLLGLETMKLLAAGGDVFTPLDPSSPIMPSLDWVCRHSFRTGRIARKIAEAEGVSRELAGRAFVAGLLHDVGRLVLAQNLPEQYGRAIQLTPGIPLSEAERAAVGTTHPSAGAYLLGLWGFDNSVVEAIACHHEPATCTEDGFSPAVAVHVADILEEESRPAPRETPPMIDEAFLSRRRLLDRLPVWRELARQVD